FKSGARRGVSLRPAWGAPLRLSLSPHRRRGRGPLPRPAGGPGQSHAGPQVEWPPQGAAARTTRTVAGSGAAGSGRARAPRLVGGATADRTIVPHPDPANPAGLPPVADG